MLDAATALGLLVDRGLIEQGAAGDGWSVRCLSRRNDNIGVEGPHGAGFMIKRLPVAEPRGGVLLGREAVFAAFCHAAQEAAVVAALIPRLLHREADDALLAFELIRQAESLWTLHHEPVGAGAFPVEVGEAIGRALGTLHRTFRRPAFEGDSRLDWLPMALPWAFSVHRPTPENLSILCQATCELLREIQAVDALGERLDALSKRWRLETVIHGDVKFDNILLGPPRDGLITTSPRVWLVDWESVALGDPAWDIAGAFQDFLHLWVVSMPFPDAIEIDLGQAASEARHSLTDLRAASRALWQGYGAEVGDPDPDLLARSVAFSAARLIQTACEIAIDTVILPLRPRVLLRIAANILADPGLAQLQLFGITGDLPSCGR